MHERENPDGHYKVHQPFRKEYAGLPEIYPATEGQGNPVFFEKENINTMDAKGEVMLTIMASLAQQESESLSQNVKIGLQYRYQQGLVQVNHNRFLGYTKDAEGHLVIKPEEAEVVKRIYREYLEGASLCR